MMTPGMICKKCGGQLLMGAEYCTKCGAPIPGLPAKRKKRPALLIVTACIAGIVILGAFAVGGVILLSSLEVRIPLTFSFSNPSAEKLPATVQQDEGTVDGNKVKILNAAKGVNIDGSPAIIINYEWTNNGLEPTSFAAAFTATAYQSGIELNQPVWVSADNSTGLMDYYSKIQPGITQTVKCAYSSDDYATDLTVEVTGPKGNEKVVKTLTIEK